MRKKKSFASPWIGEIITEGPCKGYRACEAWPADMEVHDTRASGSRRSERLLDHTGWYTDHFQDGMQYAAAVKVRVPRRRAKFENVMEGRYGLWSESMTRVRWVEAIAHTDWDCISIDRRTLHDTLGDAIRAADSVAERVAEIEREADAKDQAERQIQEKREEIAQARATLKRVLGARKRLAMAVPEVCEDLASYVSDQLQEIRKARKRIALLERETWEAVA
jgi:bacterioferritin (cytochrome b1)